MQRLALKEPVVTAAASTANPRLATRSDAAALRHDLAREQRQDSSWGPSAFDANVWAGKPARKDADVAPPSHRSWSERKIRACRAALENEREHLALERQLVREQPTRVDSHLAEAHEMEREQDALAEGRGTTTRAQSSSAQGTRRVQEFEAQAKRVLAEEICTEESAWLARVAMPSWQEMRHQLFGKVHSIESELAQHELAQEERLEEEFAQLEASGEAAAAAFLAREWDLAEKRIAEEARCLQASLAAREDAAIRQQEAWRQRKQKEEKQAAFDRETRRRHLQAQVSSAAVRGEEEAALELHSLLEQRYCLEEQLCLVERSGDAELEQELAELEFAQQVHEEQTIARTLQAFYEDYSMRTNTLESRIAAVQATGAMFQASAQDSAARTEELRQEYTSRVGRLLAARAQLEDEQTLLAEERRRLHMHMHGNLGPFAQHRSAMPSDCEFGVYGRGVCFSPVRTGARTDSASVASSDAVGSSVTFAAAQSVSPMTRVGVGAFPSAAHAVEHPASSSTSQPNLVALPLRVELDASWSTSGSPSVSSRMGATSPSRRASPLSHGRQPDVSSSFGLQVLVASRDEVTTAEGMCPVSESLAEVDVGAVEGGANTGRVKDKLYDTARWRADAPSCGSTPLDSIPTSARISPAVVERSTSRKGTSPSQSSGVAASVRGLVALQHALAEDEIALSPNLPNGGHEPIPLVYEAAISAVERYGWQRVHQGAHEWTALHWAASEGRTDVCRRLLRAAADPSQPDHSGRTAVDYSHKAGHTSTWRVLVGAAEHHDATSPCVELHDADRHSSGESAPTFDEISGAHAEASMAPSRFPYATAESESLTGLARQSLTQSVC